MSIHLGYNHLSFDELVARMRREPDEPDVAADPELAATYYMDVGFALGDLGEQGLSWLLAEAPRVEGDERRLRGVLAGLGRREMPKDQAQAARVVFRHHLSDARPLIVMAAIDGLGMLQDTEAMNVVLALRANPSEWVRGAVLTYMQSCAPAQAVPMALDALGDVHFMVRETAIDTLDELGVAGQYLDRIRPLLHDEHPHVRSAAEWAIEATEERDDEESEGE